MSGPLGRKGFVETRFQARHQTLDSSPLTDVPAVTVLDAFTSGGAQIDGGRDHQRLRAGDRRRLRERAATRRGSVFLLEGGRYRSDEIQQRRRHVHVHQPRRLRARRGPAPSRSAPATRWSATRTSQLGWYAQDDIRLARSLSLSVGLRQEVQTHLDDRLNLAPRAGRDLVAVQERRDDAPRRRRHLLRLVRRADVRADAAGRRRPAGRSAPSSTPAIPIRSPAATSAVLPSGRIVQSPDLVQPAIARTNLAVEQALGKYARVNVLYGYARSRTALRGHDVNAPLADGERPDPSSGTVTQVESTARLATHMLHTGLNLNLPWHRTSLFANYTLGHAMNESDSPFSLPGRQPGPARGVGAVTQYDARHRASPMFNMNLWKGFKLATIVNSSSGLPYNITTGFDDNRRHRQQRSARRASAATARAATAAGMSEGD